MQYTLTYRTINRYDRPPPEIYLEYLILPAEDPHQSLINFHLKTRPSAHATWWKNKYGFRLLRFLHLRHINTFSLELTSEVELRPYRPVETSWRALQKETEILQSAVFRRENFFFLRQTHLTRPVEPIGRSAGESAVQFALRAMNLVYDRMSYEPSMTDTKTTAAEAWQAGKGVCQDYAHILTGLFRSAGLPARYVSGYMYIGRDETAQLHAWTEVLIPGLGWWGLDAANHLPANENYIKIAHGTDYTECASLKGVVRSSAENSTEYQVSIQQQNQQ